MKKIFVALLISSGLLACGSGNNSNSNNDSGNQNNDSQQSLLKTSFQAFDQNNKFLIYGNLTGLSGYGYNKYDNTKVSLNLYNNETVCGNGNFEYADKIYTYKIKNCGIYNINDKTGKVIIGDMYLNGFPNEMIILKLNDPLYKILNKLPIKSYSNNN